MKRRVPMTVALLGGLLLFALAPAARGGHETLFPDLRGEDFPSDANHVRFEWLEAERGSLVGQTFHTRPNDVVFPGLVTAAVSEEPKTGATVLQVVRLDDDCLAYAAQIDAPPDEACLAMTATSIAPGVERLTLQADFFDYRLRFYLVQSREDAAEWNLALTGRKGEPQVLRLRTRDEGDSLVVDWELSYRDERHEVSLPLRVTLPADAIRDAGLSTVHAALLSSPEMFYDIADFLVWEVMREDQIVDTGIPGPADEDDDSCEVLTMCPAEYQSCTPTTGGWLACGGMGDRWGGGGVACPPSGIFCGGMPEDRVADWVTPMTPEFRGLVAATGGGHRLDYVITSALFNEDTVARESSQMPPGGHVVRVTLTRDGSTAPTTPLCQDVRFQQLPADFKIPRGSTRKYSGSAGPATACGGLSAGLYQLHYALDPFFMWDEETGESDNTGTMRGKGRVK
jgi:hypothetical protein